MHPYASVFRITTIIAATISLVVAAILPTSYYVISYQYTAGSLAAEAELTSYHVERLVLANPKMWQFEEIRLQELLQHRHGQGIPAIWRINDMQGNLIAQAADPVSPPMITRRTAIYDAGTPVAEIEVSQSLRSLLMKTALISIFSVALGLLIFIVLRTIPLKALEQAYQSLLEKEQAARKSDEMYRLLTEIAPNAISVANPNGIMRMINKRALELYMHEDETEVLGRSFFEWVLPEERQRAASAFESLLNVGFASNVEVILLRKNGSSFPAIINASLLRASNGEPQLVIIVTTDVTEQRLLEEERLKTQKLESIGTLAGGIAHDFNNLLQGVFGYISMAKLTHDQKDKSLAMLEQAEEALHLSVNLTTQLLTFSKGGKPVKNLMRLEPVIENAVKLALSGSHTDYRLDIAPDLWSVEADAGQLAQVIQNIVINANEAMAGKGTVNVSVRNTNISPQANLRLPDGGQFARIDIQDTGTGISEQNISKIFDPYFTTKQRGSGLGLATSYSIITNHGGFIEAQSEQNRGTTFTIYLPASMGTEITVEPTTPTVATTRKMKILIMDDEDIVRSVAKEMIAALGHEVEGAVDGNRAIELFSKAREQGRPFDLVILDLTVKGGMGGQEAMARIREIDPNVKAAVSSGYADSPVVADYRSYGFFAVLNKPYRIDTLKDCLRQFVL